jgi:adenylosuccinate lyase
VNMKANLAKTHGLIFSQEVLLAMTKAGMKREDAYRIVQEEAMKVWQGGQDFRTLLGQRKDVISYVSSQELDRLFDATRSLKNVDYIFHQVGIE